MHLPQATSTEESPLNRGVFASFLRGWVHRREAARYCKRLCWLFEQERDADPGLTVEALYVRVVQRDLDIGPMSASEIVHAAAESYARWPTPRAVSFRDVARYLIALRLSTRNGWVESELRPAVDGRVPSGW